MKKRFWRVLLFGLIGLTSLCIVAAGISYAINQNLPKHSQATERLTELEKARLAEAIHLRQSLGDTVWPGWGQAEIPLVVYNEQYAFLVGVRDPAPGWVKMPQNERRGSAWEPVPDDAFQGQTYYRQGLPDPEITPENFTVLVGEQWAASMETKEYMEASFYDGFPEQLPPVLRPIFPYRIIWGLLMGETENYIGGLEHEAFHALEGSLAPDRLEEAEQANQNESRYPWEDSVLQDAWSRETGFLVRAIGAETDQEAADLVGRFLAQRDDRRKVLGLSPELVDYERQREWLEGLAKYAEISAGRLAGSTPGYTFFPALADDPDFKAYASREKFWEGQIDEAKRTAGREGETRFYYSGMAQAVVLDRLLPGWKERAFQPGVMLEDLLREATAR